MKRSHHQIQQSRKNDSANQNGPANWGGHVYRILDIPVRGRHKAFFVKLYYFNIALHGESAASSFVDLLQYFIKWIGGAAGNHVSATLFYALRWWCTHLKPMFRPRATTYYRSLHITIYTFSDEYYYEPCVQNNYNFAAAAAPRNMADRWRNISVQKPQLLSCFNSVLPKSIHLELDLPFFFTD